MYSRYHGLSTSPRQNDRKSTYTKDAAHRFEISTQPEGGELIQCTKYSSRSQVRVHQLQLGEEKLCGGAGVRVGSSSQEDLGGAASAAPKPWESRSREHDNGCSRVRKRTYIRAMRRLRRHGQARYKGKLLHDTGKVVDACATGRENRPGPDRSTFFTWNCSGLSPEVLTETLVWAADTRASFFVLQETHWGFTSDWSSDGWHFIHSAAAKPKTGGVLVALRTDLLSTDSIRWSELVPGRLLQVRCVHGRQALDILAVYQQVKIRGDADAVKANLDRRAVVWRTLEKTLRSLPCRSYVVLAGDFNTSFGSKAPFTGGSSVDTETLDAHKKRVRMHWSYACCNGSGGLEYLWQEGAYIYPSQGLQPDRLHHGTAAGCRFKGSAVVRSQVSYGKLENGGAQAGTCQPYRLDWRPWLWKTGRGTATKPGRASGLHSDLNRLKDMISRDFGSQVAPAGFAAPSIERPTGLVRASWEAKRRYSEAGTGTLRLIFAKLRLFANFLKAQREMRQEARRAKRKRLMQVLETAEEAASRGDSRTMYRCVRFLSNQRGQARVRLKGDHGAIITGEEECNKLIEDAKRLFTGDCVGEIVLERLGPELFSVDRWQRALLLLRSGKAVPQGEPAIESWKLGLQRAAEALSQISIVCLCCDDPIIPVEWSEIQLAWLAKPGKSPCVPKNLRSVGLMSADSKAFLLVLRGHVEGSIRKSLYDIPQYSYRPGMDTRNAILRAVSHCKAVRSLQKQAVQNHTARVLGAIPPELQGGLLVSLDVSKAFDSVPHKELFLAMLEAGVESSMARLILRCMCKRFAG